MEKSEKTEAKPAEPAQQATAGQPAAAPKKNNTLVVILVVLGILLLCCGGGALAVYLVTKRAVDTVTDTLANPTSVSDLINNVVDDALNTDNSSGAFGKLVADWPSDVPLMSKDEILYSGSQTQEDGSKLYSVSYNVSKTVAEVTSYYKSEMPNNGWTLDSESTLFGATLSYKKGNNEAVIYSLEGDGGKTLVTLSVTVK